LLFPSSGSPDSRMEFRSLIHHSYRLNILGFPGNPNATANLGFLDQRLAIEWVRDNIEKFGGDLARITLFGQSAGGASVDYYSYAWNDDPIAAGFIPESGTVFSWGLPNRPETTAVYWFNVTASVGCGDATSNPADVLSCMRKQNYTSILSAIPTFSGTAGILGGFGPTVDDKVVFANYREKTPANVPMLIGNNNYEGGLFRTEFALSGLFFPDVFWDDFNLQEFTCPAGIRANASIAAKIPIWRYRYMGVFPNLAISTEAGTWHAAEIPMLFNTAPLAPPSTPEQVSIGNYMRGAWTAFAKDPKTGLTNYGWPTYNTSGDTLVRLAYDNITGANLINPYRYDADCVFVNVSSTDTSANAYPTLPDLGASVTPTRTSSGTGPSQTAGTTSGSGMPTGSAPASTTSSSDGGKLGVSIWVGLGAFAVAWLL
jgi:cholinesterase